MKPNDLLNAIGDISERHILESKPHRRRRRKSRRNADAEAAVRNGSMHIKQHSRSRKAGTDMNNMIPVWQRAVTAVIACTACAAVFIGGYMMLHTDSGRTEPVESVSDDRTNFLGGQGEIHASADGMLMYDDSQYYFCYGSMYQPFLAERSGGQTGVMYLQENPQSCFWDGACFYKAEGDSLYCMDMYGNQEAEPFYTIKRDALENGAEIDKITFAGIQKLAEDYCFIRFYTECYSDAVVNWNNIAYGFLYQPESGQQYAVPDASVIAPDAATDDGTNIVAMASNSVFYRFVRGQAAFEEMASVRYRRDRSKGWMIDNGSIYYMPDDLFYTDAESSRTTDARYHYAKTDLATEAYTEILPDAPFSDFIPYDGRIFALSRDHTQILCADPEWQNAETVYDFNASAPQTVRDAIGACSGENGPIMYLHAVDENYILLQMQCCGDSPCMALIDRAGGDVRYFMAQQGI